MAEKKKDNIVIPVGSHGGYTWRTLIICDLFYALMAVAVAVGGDDMTFVTLLKALKVFVIAFVILFVLTLIAAASGNNDKSDGGDADPCMGF
jgi:hypothetical protein